jgi:GNAT superfamily N-acetyltransferase
VFYWETEHFLFLEHLATRPDKRGQGFGAAALELLKAKGKPIVLEIEPPVDALTRRRLGFYERNGLVLNPYRHIQAKYHPGDDDLELKILSHPRVLTQDEYDAFYAYMIKEVSLCGA